MAYDRATLFNWLAKAGLTKMAAAPAVDNPTTTPVVLFSVTFPRRTLVHTLLVMNYASVAMSYTLQQDIGAGWVDLETVEIGPASYHDMAPQLDFEPGQKIRLGIVANPDADGTSNAVAQYIMLTS